MAIDPELIAQLLALPEPERADLAWRLVESLRDGSDMDDLLEELRNRRTR